MKFSLYIAKRYLFSKTSTNAINIITFIAVFGVVVGSLALFVILSGFSGLRTFSDSMLSDSDPDIKITATVGKTFVYSDQIHQKLLDQKEIKETSKIIEERVYLKYGDKSQVAFIKGVDKNYNKIIPIVCAL